MFKMVKEDCSQYFRVNSLTSISMFSSDYRYQMESVSDAVIIGTIMFMCKTLHDSVKYVFILTIQSM